MTDGQRGERARNGDHVDTLPTARRVPSSGGVDLHVPVTFSRGVRQPWIVLRAVLQMVNITGEEMVSGRREPPRETWGRMTRPTD